MDEIDSIGSTRVEGSSGGDSASTANYVGIIEST